MVVIDTPDIPVNYSNNFLHAESMSHWLHCNGCYCTPETVKLPFYITSCSHIYCEKCVTPCTNERCKICRSQCTTLMLNSKIPKEVESLFSDPVELHQKLTKQFYQTLEFQKSHQRRLIRQFKEKVKAFEHQITEVKGVIMQAQSMEREFMKMKAENDYLKLLLSKKDPHLRPSSRSSISPSGHSASPHKSAYEKNYPSRSYGSCQQRSQYNGTSTNILTQPGRLLVRTPPSDGHLGTVGGLNCTPTSIDGKSKSFTPISIPRPIHLYKSE